MTRSPRSSPERRLLPALLLAGAVLLIAAPAAAASPQEVQARARTVLSDPRFQRELPAHSEARERGASRSRRAGEVSSEPSVIVPVIGAGAFLARTVFMVLAVVAVVLLLSWLGGEIVRRRRASRKTTVAEGPAEVRTSQREPTFDDAARLAAEGCYAEAIHALLLAAIRHSAQRSRVAVEPSRTSRELIRLLPLGAEARDAFAELVRTVERSLFGGVSVGAEEYERSLSRFRLLTRRSA